MIMSVKGFWFDSGWDFPSGVDGSSEVELQYVWKPGYTAVYGILVYPPTDHLVWDNYDI